MTLRTEFYADRDDMLMLLKAFRVLGKFKYTLGHGELNSGIVTHADPVEILDVGAVNSENPHRRFGYVITEEGTPVIGIAIAMSDGSGSKHIVDQVQNPDSVRLALGGNAGDRTLISSLLVTTGETKSAKKIYKLFAKVVKGAGRPIAGMYVLPNAMAKLQDGWRLTGGKTFAPELDLLLPE